MILVRKYSFQAARKLTKIAPDHICANLHGHTFHITIRIEGPINKKNDFVMDFYDIDKIFNKSVFNLLDHKYLNDIKGLESPTTENLAKWIWNKLVKKLPILKEVNVFENDVYGCVYKGD
ncbi:MAG: 6-carboxytetrahydropterin synthase QueD [Candidatus Pelagibacter sp. TMED166]|mgnify:CR=1 FL=1|nr:MAG: 6-carboxytetrahydropterin synthase QueD [Candidatus Pelagibacter sp. TMED166]|tara:strand:- start:3707 stop:4066 length:360 start_codon:yes stop_codon:yes gene_type:complete